ncbi:MAG: molybdate ABC transporter substrate-binding protein [Flavobacteriales bacterium]|nr:molybdate ABC transporter substrate-binding protein [Flavobacteriales bacterium]
MNQTTTSLKWTIALLLFAFLSACKSEETPLRISAASSMQFVMEELIADYEQRFEVDCELITTSSGKLKAQIEMGAPYDVFVSADGQYTQALAEKGKVVGEPIPFVTGRLAIFMTKGLGITDLLKGNFEHLTMPNPETAPYGRAAKEYLEGVKIYDLYQDRIVTGESAAQSNQHFVSGAAEIALLPLSMIDAVAEARMEAGTGSDRDWANMIDATFHAPIEHSIIIVDHQEAHAKAPEFVSYLQSEDAWSILKNFGYSRPN